MDRTIVESFDRNLMDSSDGLLYIGDRRLKQNKSRVSTILDKADCQRVAIRISESDCKNTLNSICCKAHGMFESCIPDVKLLMQLRHQYHKDLSSKDRQNFLTELWTHRFNRGRWEVSGISLCFLGVCYALGIAKGTLQKAKFRAVWGIEKVELAMHLDKRIAYLTGEVKSWIDDYVLRYTERMPHKTFLHLPSCYTKDDLATMCRLEIKVRTKEDELRSPSKRLFYAVWSEYFPHVTIPRVSDFDKCNFCAKAAERQLHHRMNAQDKLQLEKDKLRKSMSNQWHMMFSCIKTHLFTDAIISHCINDVIHFFSW